MIWLTINNDGKNQLCKKLCKPHFFLDFNIFEFKLISSFLQNMLKSYFMQKQAQMEKGG